MHRIDDIDEYNEFVEWINSDSAETLRGNSVKNSLLTEKYSIFNTAKGSKAIDIRSSFLEKAYNQTFEEINNKRKLQ